MSLAYLASPYTPHNGESMEERVDAACKAAARLMQEGICVFAPIPHSHYIAEHMGEELRFDHEFWMEQDLAVLRHCTRLIVLKLPGWMQSEGVMREIEVAKHVGIPVTFLDPDD